MTYYCVMNEENGEKKESEVVFGRHATVAEIWRLLEKRSVYMNDLRRIGKTMILRAMKEKPKEGWAVIKRDLGRCHSPEDFAALVYRDVIAELEGATKFMRQMQGLLGQGSGAQIGPIKLPDGRVAPWKEVLERTFADLDAAIKKKEIKVVFLWDEVPFLLDNIIKNAKDDQGERLAMQVLDVMRSLGQDYPNVKMVLTGSIGLHHILSQLRDENYINSPLNDMKPLAPGPLSPEDGIKFAERMLKERGVEWEERCGETIATLVGHVPFYIESFIDGLRSGEKIRNDDLEAVLAERLTNPDDDWDLPHHANRLKRYFGDDEAQVLAILDFLAGVDEFRSNAAIMDSLQASGDRQAGQRGGEKVAEAVASRSLSRKERGRRMGVPTGDRKALVESRTRGLR